MKITPERDASGLLKQLDQAGLFATDEDTARAVFNTAASLGFNAYRVDLGLATDARKLMQIMGRSLRFPDWFGMNWDALTDCLGDMSWSEADGYVLILQRLENLQEREPDAVVTFFELLRETIEHWRKQRIPFWVLVEGQISALAQIKVAT